MQLIASSSQNTGGMKYRLDHSFLLLLLLLFISRPAGAQVRLPHLISDGMVLQRDAKIKLRGWAAPGEKIRLTFDHKNYKATADPAGKWMLVMAPMKAGGPYTMQIDASNRILLQDIWVGDVWFCSGQSNMVLNMERVKERYPAAIAEANYPQIRNYFVSTISDVSKQYDDLPPGSWQGADPQQVLNFGAASYFFARTLYLKYHVPIGIINSSVGGTPVQAWISGQGLKDITQYAQRLAQLQDTAYFNRISRRPIPRNDPDSKAGNAPGTGLQMDKGLRGPKTWYDTSYIPEGWHPFWLPGYWADQGIRDLNGVVWFRKEIEVPPSMTGKPARLFMGRVVDADIVYVNGVQSGATTYQYPPRRYVLPAGLLKPGKNIIVVKVVNTAGKGGFVPEKPYFLATGDDRIDLRGDWQYKVGQVFNPARGGGDGPFYSAQNEPTGLYNTMVAPAIDYTIKGFVWYQGEANTSRPKEYGTLLSALISDWRAKWNEGMLPFIYAQLPNFMETQYSPSESGWAELREQQLETLSVPNTGMAVTIDAGEWNDIHPLDKKDVGERLALAAEKLAYGESGLVASGPVYRSALVEGNKIRISFSSIGGGLTAKGGGELMQFAIAGSDRKYVWANARIEGDQVLVWSEAIDHPLYVRYAWSDNPDGANLYNKEGLPASPFTTDRQ
jgi:sialate O-acetylesterase